MNLHPSSCLARQGGEGRWHTLLWKCVGRCKWLNVQVCRLTVSGELLISAAPRGNCVWEKGTHQGKRKLQRDRLTRFAVWRAEGLSPRPSRGPDVHGKDSLVSSSRSTAVGRWNVTSAQSAFKWTADGSGNLLCLTLLWGNFFDPMVFWATFKSSQQFTKKGQGLLTLIQSGKAMQIS